MRLRLRLRWTEIRRNFPKKSEEKFGYSEKKRYLCNRKRNQQTTTMKRIITWFKTTKMWMNISNRLNGVEILTEEEYFNLWNGKTVEA